MSDEYEKMGVKTRHFAAKNVRIPSHKDPEGMLTVFILTVIFAVIAVTDINKTGGTVIGLSFGLLSVLLGIMFCIDLVEHIAVRLQSDKSSKSAPKS